MTRQDFIDLAKGFGYGYSDEDIKDILSLLGEDEVLPGVTERDVSFELAGVSTEEEWLDYYAKNFLVHY